MTRICLVTHFFPPHVGGIEKVADEQSRRLIRLGYEISVLTCQYKRKSHTREIKKMRAEPIEVEHYSTLNIAERIGIPYPILSIGAYKKFSDIIKKCDIVHAHGHPYMSSYLASKVATRYDKPFVLTQHNTFIDYQSWLNLFEHLNDHIIGKFVLREAEKVIVVSRKTLDYVLKIGVDRSKTSVMYNGVDTDFFHPMSQKKSRSKLGLPEDKQLVLTVRRLVFKNGLDTFIEAASILTQDFPDLLFIIIGTGPNRSLIEKRIRELQIHNNVRLVGFIPESMLPLYYNAADCFVIPSSSGEGLPLVLLEAMACGLPVVATSVGGIPEIIEEMKNGVLIPPKDSEALARQISIFLLNKHQGLIIGKEARRIVEKRFTWEVNVRKLQAIYEELL